MFTWWKRRKSAALQKYQPKFEPLETRETPTATLKAGPVVNVSQAFGNQREQSIAINPQNPNQVAAFSNVEDITGDNVADDGLFAAYSQDGGLTWTTQFLFIDDTFPEAACCDPQAAWDQFGNLFLTYLTFDGNTAVAHSVDGGQTFSVQLLTDNDDSDQPSIAVGPGKTPGSGQVWVSYFNDDPIPHIELWGGITGPGFFFMNTGPVTAPGSDAALGNFGDVAIGPAGQVVVTYQSNTAGAVPSAIWINVDPDGTGIQPFGPRRLATATNVSGARIIPGTSNNLGIDAEANLAFDRSNSKFRGRLYLVYTDAANTTTNDTNVFVRFSDNLGVTWSLPRIVHSVATGSQFNPSIAVDQFTGWVGVAWYDTRISGAGTQAEFFCSVSDNGGATYGQDLRVSLGPSTSANSEPPATGVRALGFGDFNKIDFTRGVLQLVWADNSTQLPGNPTPGRMDIAAARVFVSSNKGPKKVTVIYPPRWLLTNPGGGLFRGVITLVNNGPRIFGPIRVQIPLVHPALRIRVPKGTQYGNTFTFVFNGGLPTGVPVRISVVLFNPLRLKLGRVVVGGFAESLA
jgi:hypothetical protein